jgi:hypothetical protein
MFMEYVPHVRRSSKMSLSSWDEGSDSDRVTGLNRDNWLVGHRKIPIVQSAKLPRYGRSLPKRDYLSLWRKGSQVKQ